MRRFSFYLLFTSVIALGGCASGASPAIPLAHASQAAGGSAAAFMRSVTPPTVLPNSVTIPQMGGLDGVRPAMSLRKPQSQIQALSFTQLPGAAVLVAASPDGTFWVLSTSGLPTGDKFIYHYVNGNFVNVPGAATRLAVGPTGTVWALNAAGGIYYLNSGGAFTGIAGGARELSIAADNSVYVISSVPGGPAGNGIYHYAYTGSPASGTWTQLPGAGVTVSASIDNGAYSNILGVNNSSINITPGGFYVTNAQGGIYYYNLTTGWVQLAGGAVALAPTASGGLFALGDPGAYQHGIYYNDLKTGQWTAMQGAAVSLSANATAVYAVGAAGGIYESSLLTGGTGIAPGAYWLFASGTSTQPLRVTWVSADGAGRQYTLASTYTGPTSGVSGIGVDAQHNIYILTATNAIKNFQDPGIPTGEQMQVFAANTTGSAAPVRTITLPNFATNFLVEADGSLLVSYAGQVRLLSPTATDFSQGTPYANLWTYYSQPPNYLAADGALARGPDGTLYCACMTLPGNLGGGSGFQTISSYATNTLPANSAPTTIARIDGTGLYGAGALADLSVAGLTVLNGMTYVAISGHNYLTPYLGALIGIPVGASGYVQPTVAITGLGMVSPGSTSCNISTGVGCNIVPYGAVTDGTNIGTELFGTFLLFAGGANGSATPIYSNAAITSPPTFVRY